MTHPTTTPGRHARLHTALREGSTAVRLRAALAAGTTPDPAHLDVLVERCAVEPDFPVREMLTWALTRLSPALTTPRLVAELGSALPQARSQALHTLSKTGDRAAWPALTPRLLCDGDEEVARSAWRAAVVLAPEEERPALAVVLASRLGRGDTGVRLSLSRALIALGEVVLPVLARAETDRDPAVRAHAHATRRLHDDPDAAVDFAVEAAKRIVALGESGQE